MTLYRRKFWANQVDNTKDCSTSFLDLKRKNNFGFFNTENKVRSLALNILFTDGEKQQTKSGYEVGSRGGHWSTTFTGAHVGTVWDFSSAKTKTDYAILAKSIASNSLQKLILLEIATSIKVDSYYKDNILYLDIEIYGVNVPRTKILVQKTPLKNEWIWQ